LFTVGLERSEAAPGEGAARDQGAAQRSGAASVPAAVRWLDLIVLAAALPIFIATGLPIVGYLTAAGAWLAQRAVQIVVRRRAAASDDPRTVVGLAAGSMIARGWFVALAIFVVGLSDNDAGLAAAVLVIALFTIYFSVQMMTRPFAVEDGPR
jgi:hypothetical protein